MSVRAGLDAASLHQSWTREWHWLLVRFYLVPHDAGRYAALQTGPLSGRSRSRSPTTTPPPQDFESLEILEQQCCRTIKAASPWSIEKNDGRSAEGPVQRGAGQPVQRLNVKPMLNLSFTSGTRPECLTIEYIAPRAAILMINRMVSPGVGRDRLPP